MIAWIVVVSNTSLHSQTIPCFQESELFQIQNGGLTEATNFMRSKGWTFNGISEFQFASISGMETVISAVNWNGPNGIGSLYYQEDSEYGNLVFTELSNDCLKQSISRLIQQAPCETAIEQLSLVTKFVINDLVIEFVERADGKFGVRLFEDKGKSKYGGLFIINKALDRGGVNVVINGRGVLGGGAGAADWSGGEAGSGPNWSLSGRTILNNPKVQGNAPDEGTVTVDIWVDKNGNVTKAIANAAKSNTSNGTLFKMAEDAARKAKFNSSASGNEQKGSIKITFKLH